MIVNLLLTRVCNLKCSYCRIIRDYKNKPEEYPSISYYYTHIKDYKYWLNLVKFLSDFNDDVFFLLYGGEPTLYPEFDILVKEMYKLKVPFSVITNGTKQDKIFELIDYLPGLTASVDLGSIGGDREKKTMLGLEMLRKAKEIRPTLDNVAEVVLDSQNYKNLPKLVEIAKQYNFRISLTIIENPLNEYYDFAEPSDENLLLKQDQLDEIYNMIQDIKKTEPEILLTPEAIETVIRSGNNGILKCNPHNLYSLTFDADGKLRTCLRIRGIEVPNIDVEYYINNDDLNGFIDSYIKAMSKDMDKLCEGCSWTCMFMPKSNFVGDFI